MLFRRRKTQELDIQDIEQQAAADGTEAFEEDPAGGLSDEDPDVGYDEYEEGPDWDPEEPEASLYDEDEDASFSYGAGDYETAGYETEDYGEGGQQIPEPQEKLSSVETGAWEYIHGEPNEDYLTDTGNFRYELDGPEGGVFLPEETEDGAEKKPRVIHVRRKHKKHHYLLKFTICCALIAAAFAFMMSSYFTVNEIRVEGMVRYSAEQIIGLSELSLGGNIFKTKTGKAEGRIEADPHIAKATIKRDLPQTLVITVEERMPAAQVAFGPEDNVQYAVFDAEGYILSVGEADETAAVLTGVTIKGGAAEAGTDLKVEEGAVLDETLSLIKAAGAAGLTFTKMDMTEKTVRLYFTDSLLIKGKPAVILKHIENGDVPLILNDLAAKGIGTGTINASTEESFTFSPAEE